MRDNCVSERRVREIQLYFDSLGPDDPALGDIAMIISDACSSNLLVWSIYQGIAAAVDRQAFPKVRLAVGRRLIGIKTPASAESPLVANIFIARTTRIFDGCRSSLSLAALPVR